MLSIENCLEYIVFLDLEAYFFFLFLVIIYISGLIRVLKSLTLIFSFTLVFGKL